MTYVVRQLDPGQNATYAVLRVGGWGSAIQPFNKLVGFLNVGNVCGAFKFEVACCRTGVHQCVLNSIALSKRSSDIEPRTSGLVTI